MPPLLKYLISMIINGQDVAVTESSADSQVCLTISQLIYFSLFKEKSKKRHGKHHEPPLPIYYRRVLELEDQLAGSVSMHFEKQGIVCPPNLRKGLFYSRSSR